MHHDPRGNASNPRLRTPATGEIISSIETGAVPFAALAPTVRESIQRSARILAEGALRLAQMQGGCDEAL